MKIMETNQTKVTARTSSELDSLFGTSDPNQLPEVIEDTPSSLTLVNHSEISPEASQRVSAIVENFNLSDTNLVLMYGSEPQRKLSVFLDSLLEGIKVKDVDVAGEMVLQMSDGINLMQLSKVKASINSKKTSGFMVGLINSIGLGKNYIKAFYESQKLVTSKMDKIEDMAQNQISIIAERNEKLDSLVEHSIQQVLELEVFILAGEEILELAKLQYAEKAQEVKKSRNQLEASNLRDMGRQLAAFDVRLLRLKEAYVEAGSATIERIRQIQEAGKIEIQGLNDGILFTIPKIKKAILQVAALNDIKTAQEARKKMDEIDAQLDAELSESTNSIHTAAKKSQGDALDRVRRLEGVISNIEKSIQDSIRIEKSTQEMREEAGKTLVGLKDRITDTLSETNLKAAGAV